MNKNISTTYIDEMLVLCLLDEEQADASEICDRISYLSGGAVAYDLRYAGLLLFRLKKDNLIKKNTANFRYCLTDKGADELKERLLFFSEYEKLANRFEKEKKQTQTDVGIDFEEAFGNFIDRCEYDKAENALFTIVRSAFTSGWNTAGGKPPKPQTVLRLIKP